MPPPRGLMIWIWTPAPMRHPTLEFQQQQQQQQRSTAAQNLGVWRVGMELQSTAKTGPKPMLR